ncbi:MAG: tetratricopeptide repeat protein [Bacteroidota bacterium]|nr:tetratricopeptide repeat protein [Bacteroidota bacterium]
MKRIFIFFIFLGLGKTITPQNKNVDSLKNILSSLPADTQKVNVLYDLAYRSFDSDPDITIKYGNEALDIAQKQNSPKHIANVYNVIALGYSIKNEYQNALKYFENALVVREKIKDKNGVAKILGNMGNIYWNMSDYPKALDHQLRSLKLKEEAGNKQGVANSLGNIANIYSSLGDDDKALYYHFECIKIADQLGNKKNIEICFVNIGTIYEGKRKHQLAIDYFTKALKISEETGNKLNIAGAYGNIGLSYIGLGKYQLADDYLKKSLAIRNELGDRLGIASVHHHLGVLNLKSKNYKAAEENFLLALQISKELGIEARERDILKDLSHIYIEQKKFEQGFEYFKKFIKLRDTLINLSNNKLIIQKQLKYDYEKKAVADSIKTSEEKKIAAFQLKQEKTQKYALYGGLILVLLFSIFIFNRFKVTQKQKIIIEQKEKETQKQKHLIEEKQKEIVDSINYAKRLQDAILPQVNSIKESFSKLNGDACVVYQPKDIVAGDFYFFEDNNDHLFIAAADCTGHGVPGAMVSVVCSNALTRSVNEFNLTDPGEILDKTTELVLDTFSKSVGQVKDGMDISLLCIDKKNKIIAWSGANNPLWYLENGNIINELKPNKQPIGRSDDPQPFVTHTLSSAVGRTFYLITDGYADQFGGAEGKKLKSKNFKNLLSSISTLSLDEQATIVLQNFNIWKGTYEQVDDVCVIGIRI